MLFFFWLFIRVDVCRFFLPRSRRDYALERVRLSVYISVRVCVMFACEIMIYGAIEV